MLSRNLRLRRSLLPRTPRKDAIYVARSASSHALALVEESSDPYGLEYGAGPSRLPYQPTSTPPSSATRHSARELRKTLLSLSHGQYSTVSHLARALFPEHENPSRQLAYLSRLEAHALLHHLLRARKGILAASVVSETIANDTARKRFSNKSILKLFESEANFRLPHIHPSPKSSRAPEATATPRPPSKQLLILLDLLTSLQKIRHRRPLELYELVIRRCIVERLPELAAKVYVGLVEEWITEGRVAEGAHPEDFHPGGGPPREQMELAATPESTLGISKLRRLQLQSSWFTGVRTWCWPGESLSPHDRLDLWHPQHLSLGEKMRNFPLPLPTSPPSMVPEPEEKLLSMILASLQLDPETCSPPEFTSSMRALAILANPVLSRTLPIGALPKLLVSFRSVRAQPAVYPEGMVDIPTNDPSAYTAYTHVHVALLSLLFSPPSYSYSSAVKDYIYKHPPTPTFRPPDQASRYQLPPLNWKSCIVLLQYGLRMVKQPRLVTQLVEYMQTQFGMGKEARAWNILFRSGTLLREDEMAERAEDVLFGGSPLGKPVPQTAAVHSKLEIVPSPPDRAIAFPAVPKRTPIQPDAYSLTALIAHLGATSQFDRLNNLVYKLLPFLSFSKSLSQIRVDEILLEEGIWAGTSGRPRADVLTPYIYTCLISALEKGGKTGLAQRVFHLALQAEEQRGHAWKLPIAAYTSMMRIWEMEYRTATRQRLKPGAPEAWPIGWSTPRSFGNQPRHLAASQMAVHVYHLAKRHDVEMDGLFIRSYVAACRGRWALKIDAPIAGRHRTEVVELKDDLRRWGLDVPEEIERKLGWETSKGWKAATGRSWYPETQAEKMARMYRRWQEGKGADVGK
ncbi:hypothetical protein P7C73_g6247, partial [Tremellales sp. Uapishka_1]